MTFVRFGLIFQKLTNANSKCTVDIVCRRNAAVEIDVDSTKPILFNSCPEHIQTVVSLAHAMVNPPGLDTTGQAGRDSESKDSENGSNTARTP